MDYKPLKAFEFSALTEALIADVETLAQKVNEFRPLTPKLVEAVHQKLFAERVYSSNAIEGNTLTLRETRHILATGHVSERRKREGTEALNLGKAVQKVEEELLPGGQSNQVDRFLGLHHTLMVNLEATAGQFRNERVMISGAKHQPPRAELVPELIEKMFAEVTQADDVNAVKVATWVHWAITRIHPFIDGNGRIARLWQDLVLLRAKLAPAIIRLQDRDQNGYYDALSAADEGDINPLAQLISQRTAATLEEYVSAQQQLGDLTNWAAKIAGEKATQVSEQRRAKYLRWARVFESLRNDFQRCAARITESGVEVQFRGYPTIDEIAWENIRNGIGANQTWFFTLTFRQSDRKLTYLFSFGKHYWKDADTELDRSEPRAALLISEQWANEEAQLLYEIKDCPLVLREIFEVDTDLVGAYLEPYGDPDREVKYTRNVVGLKLAQEFIEQVILRRLN